MCFVRSAMLRALDARDKTIKLSNIIHGITFSFKLFHSKSLHGNRLVDIVVNDSAIGARGLGFGSPAVQIERSVVKGFAVA